MVNVVHWAATHPAVENAFRELFPADWRYVSAREMPPGARREALHAADAVVVVNLDLTAADIQHLDNCRIVVHQGVGTDNIDVDTLRRRGIPLAVTTVGTTDELAEYAVLLMLTVSRRLKEITADVDVRRAWPTWDYRTRSRSMAGRRVGLVGFGRIGQAVAERLLAMKSEVHVFAGPGRQIPAPCRHRIVAVDSVEALCRVAEVVSLHVPLRPDTVGILSAERLALLPRGAIVVNTGRGALIDEAALIARLTDGHLAGAGLDVLTEEPPPPDHPLLGLPNVVVTPHLSSGTHDSLKAKARSIVERISATLLDGARVA